MTRFDRLVLLVDDDDAVRRSLKRLLAANGFRVETFASAEELLDASLPEDTGCLVLDVRLPGLDGLGLQRLLADREDELPIVFISGHGDVPMSVRAMKAGALDFLTKPVREADLVPAVSSALEASRVRAARREEVTRARATLALLSPRETEVLRFVVEGKLNKQIASELGIAVKTVKLHRGHLTRKTGLKSVAELVRLVQTAG